MARTAITVTTLGKNGNVNPPATTSVDTTNGHKVTPTGPVENLVLIIAATDTAARNYTIVAGDNPPAVAAGQGNLVLSLNNTTHWVGPLESSRFLQSDGTISIDVATGATGTITAVQLPKTV